MVQCGVEAEFGLGRAFGRGGSRIRVGGGVVGRGGGREKTAKGVSAAFLDWLEYYTCDEAAVVGGEGEGALVFKAGECDEYKGVGAGEELFDE